MKEERCCGNCLWMGCEDAYGVGWCSNNGVTSKSVWIRHRSSLV